MSIPINNAQFDQYNNAQLNHFFTQVLSQT